MTDAVYDSKSLFLVQTTHSAHIGTPFVLQGVSLFLYTVEKSTKEVGNKKYATSKWFHVWTASLSRSLPPACEDLQETLKH